MRLSDVLSKEPSMKFEQVEGFLRKGLPHGGQQKLDVGCLQEFLLQKLRK